MLNRIIEIGMKVILAGIFVLILTFFYGLQAEMIEQITNLLIF